MTVRLLMAAKVVQEAFPSAQVRTLLLAPLHRESFPPFKGGDHIQLQHRDGIRRDYSLCGNVADGRHYEIAILRQDEGRGGSVLFHEQLSVGDEVFVSYPQPGMKIDANAKHHVFVAGGIGVTAILGLLQGLPASINGQIHYCVRSRSDLVYLQRLLEFGLPVHLHISDEASRLHVSHLLAHLPPDSTLYHCGPVALTTAINEASGFWPTLQVRSEAFSAPRAITERLGDPFDAIMIAANKTVHVGETETLLQAMRRDNVPIEYSCEGGICGSCVLEVTQGEIEHRDFCLTPEERASGMMTSCVSRAAGPISVLL